MRLEVLKMANYGVFVVTVLCVSKMCLIYAGQSNMDVSVVVICIVSWMETLHDSLCVKAPVVAQHCRYNFSMTQKSERIV